MDSSDWWDNMRIIFILFTSLLFIGCTQNRYVIDDKSNYKNKEIYISPNVKKIEDTTNVCYIYKGFGISCVKKGN